MPPTSILRTTQEEYSVKFMSGELLKNAEAYCDSKGIYLIREPLLGAGTDGTVWQTREGTAVKAFERKKNYFLELECYRRFQAKEVNQILGFAVPELEGHSDSLMVVDMTIVEPPYLLDFGKVYLDVPPEYFGDKVMMDNWLAECRELFDADWPEVNSLLYALRKHGIYYVDPKPANIRFRNEI